MSGTGTTHDRELGRIACRNGTLAERYTQHTHAHTLGRRRSRAPSPAQESEANHIQDVPVVTESERIRQARALGVSDGQIEVWMRSGILHLIPVDEETRRETGGAGTDRLW